MPIKVLPPEVAAKVAAGEVVERPASVVKELVENSLDAGATQITVEIKGGGLQLIRVIDNGCGIPPGEVELAFQRFATSKISQEEDLAAVKTLGFRGEALPSIAAVAEVTMVTRSEGEGWGTLYSTKNDQAVEKGWRGSPPGTTVTVRSLFRSLPARLKFLKPPPVEARRISRLMHQFSLAFPEVRFTLLQEGHISCRSPGSGRLQDALAAVYGGEETRQMLPVAGGSEGLEITGFVSPPSLTRASRADISLFVNRRPIHQPLLAFIVEKAYAGSLPQGKHPIAVLHLFLPPQEIDVNVHPTKREVRFHRERELLAEVERAVHQALGERPAPTPSPLPPPFLPSPPGPLLERMEEKAVPALRVLGQLGSTYIIAEGPEGMYLIDQHTAHERVLFEKLQDQRRQRQVDVQGLLEPLVLEVTPRQEKAIQGNEAALKEFGLSLEPFGPGAYLVRAVPSLLAGKELAVSLREVLDSLGEEGEIKDLGERVALSLACHGAVKAGQNLSREETEALVRQLELVENPFRCPHGRPIMIHLSSRLLEREFGRR